MFMLGGVNIVMAPAVVLVQCISFHQSNSKRVG